MKSNFHTVLLTGFYAIIALAIGSYFYFAVDVSLHFFVQQPAFFFDNFFIDQYIIIPGGISKLCAYFFSQFFYNNFAGSTIIALLLVLTLVYLQWFLKLNKISKNNYFTGLIPVAILLSILTNYQASLQIIIAFHFYLVFLIINHLFIKNSFFTRIAIAIFSNVLLFYIAGSSTAIAFTLALSACMLISLPLKKGLIFAFVNLVTTTLAITTVAHFSPYIELNQVFTDLFYESISTGNKTLLIIAFVFIPFILIAYSLSKKGINTLRNKIALKTSHAILLPISALLFFAAFLFLLPQNTSAPKIKIQKLAADNQWNDVLKLSKEIIPSERKDFFQINRAMYHKGILLEKGFSVQQWFGEHGLILTPYYNSKVLMLCSDLYHEMGFIKGSLHWAYEAQTKFKLAPDVLQRIITDNLILGNLALAHKFNYILSKSITHKQWTNKIQYYIENYDEIKNDKELGKYYQLPLIQESYSNTQHPQSDLTYILNEHPDNNMAFEYQMFHAMLRHDLNMVIAYSPLLEKQGYKSIPRHIEEALIMAKTLRENIQINTGELKISTETQKRFIDYTTMLMKLKRDKSISQTAIQKAHGDTFWYYVNFVSPLTTKREFKEKEL